MDPVQYDLPEPTAAALTHARRKAAARRRGRIKLNTRDWVLINSALAFFHDYAEEEGNDDGELGPDDQRFYAACRLKVAERLADADINRGWKRDTGDCSRCARQRALDDLVDGLCNHCDKRDEEED